MSKDSRSECAGWTSQDHYEQACAVLDGLFIGSVSEAHRRHYTAIDDDPRLDPGPFIAALTHAVLSLNHGRDPQPLPPPPRPPAGRNPAEGQRAR